MNAPNATLPMIVVVDDGPAVLEFLQLCIDSRGLERLPSLQRRESSDSSSLPSLACRPRSGRCSYARQEALVQMVKNVLADD